MATRRMGIIAFLICICLWLIPCSAQAASTADAKEMISTETMRERKQIMEDRADCFIMTPGGIGTFEEFFEILTLKQLARHKKAIAIFNINGYYDAMEKMLQSAIDGKFMKAECSTLYKMFTDADEMLDYLERYDEEFVNVYHMKNI